MAKADYMREYRSRRMPGALRAKARERARYRALLRLGREHPHRLEMLIREELLNERMEGAA